MGFFPPSRGVRVRRWWALSMSHADDVPDIDVLREDQQRINLFGRLNNKKHLRLDNIKAIKDKLQNYEDAQTEMMLMEDDENIKYAIGETYTEFDADTANEMLEAEMEELQKQLESEEEAMT